MTKRSSSHVLILANLIPLAGVLLFEWDILAKLLLYWTESVVIGVVNVLKMVFSQSDNVLKGLSEMTGRPILAEVSASLPQVSINAFKYFLVPFFVVHYGGFCYGHLIVVLGFFSDAGLNQRAGMSLTELWQGSFWIAVAAIFSSHLFSFFRNYMGGGEYKRASLFLLMHRPYGRIIVMHVAIVLGAGLVMWLGSPLPMLLILIALKTFIDMRLHEKERGKLSAAHLLEA